MEKRLLQKLIEEGLEARQEEYRQIANEFRLAQAWGLYTVLKEEESLTDEV